MSQATCTWDNTTAILFVETYLTCDDATAKFLVGANCEYDLCRYDRTNRAGGGVVVYCKRVLNPVRPPNYTNMYHDNMCRLITFLTLNSECIALFGNFNLPGIQWPNITCPNTHAHRSFAARITENSLTQHVEFPTRGHTILDLILSSDPMAVTQVNAIDKFRSLHNASDHSSIVCNVNTPYVSTSECHNTGHFDVSCVNWYELLYGCPI